MAVGPGFAARVPWNAAVRRHSNLLLAPDPASHYNRGSPPSETLMTSRRRLLATAALCALLACAIARPALAQHKAPPLLVLGDSISAAYGLPAGTGWVDLLATRLKERGYALRVINASISGDTTAGGRARLPTLLAQHRPGIVIIELGGNDGLRGGDLKATRENLDTMVAAAAREGAKVLLVGMRLPPNYGPAYTRQFDALYAEVAAARKVPLVPFFFDGFGDKNDLFQPDRIHPSVAAQPLLLDNVWPRLEPLLGKPR
jgi:acyl-CoA thioesterase-1